MGSLVAYLYGRLDVALINNARKARSTVYKNTSCLFAINYFEDIPRKKGTITTSVLDGEGQPGPCRLVVNGSGSGQIVKNGVRADPTVKSPL